MPQTPDSPFDVPTLETREAGDESIPDTPIALTIAWHPNVDRVGERYTLPFGETMVSRRAPIFATVAGTETGPLLNPHVSRRPLSINVGLQSVLLTPPDSRRRVTVEGAELDRPRSWSRAQLERGLCIMLGNRVLLILHLHPVTERTLNSHGMVGESAVTARLRLQIEKASRGGMGVLIRGETGSGKELVAQAIHAAGSRASQPFVVVNMAAVPETTAAAAFFGHRRGAFTGADGDRPGYFGAADKGTLFLDEIGETPLSLQPLLLRALESGEVQPVGARGPRTVDVQVIAATDAKLERLIRQGVFKPPLYHRLRKFEIVVPPLRDRLDDVPRLLLHFLRERLESLDALHHLEYEPDRKPWLPARMVYGLMRRPWRGNVRDLRNTAHRIAFEAFDQPQVRRLPRDERIEATPLPAGRSSGKRPTPPPKPTPKPPESGRITEQTGRTNGEPSQARQPVTSRTDQSRPKPVMPPPRPDPDILVAGDGAKWAPDHLEELLRREAWSAHRAAKLLEVSKTSFYRFINRTLGIRKTTELTADELVEQIERFDADLDAVSNALRVPKRGLKIQLRTLGIDLEAYRKASALEEEQLVELLERVEGDLEAASSALGVTMRALAWRLRALKIDPEQLRR